MQQLCYDLAFIRPQATMLSARGPKDVDRSHSLLHGIIVILLALEVIVLIV